MDAVRPTGCGVAKPGVLGQTHDHAVVGQEALLVAHQPVAALAHRQRRHDIGVEHVEELARIRPLDHDLAKGGDIQQPHLRPRVQDFPMHRLLMRLARARIAIGAAPEADRLHIGALCLVPFVHRAAAQRLEDVAARLACQPMVGV